jgi:ketosteroid isomerase-like protein
VRLVTEREQAFARTMAERDFAAFARYVSADAVFFNGTQPLVGRDAVLAAWRGFYTSEAPPFSWEPTTVVVVGDGTLAHSSGPVKDPQGTVIAEFNSVWRREADGEWRVVFDKGATLCRCAEPRRGAASDAPR